MDQRGPFSDERSFKTAVGRGAFSLIGATTLAEYRHYIAPDQALARQFGLVKIEPPTPLRRPPSSAAGSSNTAGITRHRYRIPSW